MCTDCKQAIQGAVYQCARCDGLRVWRCRKCSDKHVCSRSNDIEQQLLQTLPLWASTAQAQQLKLWIEPLITALHRALAERDELRERLTLCPPEPHDVAIRVRDNLFVWGTEESTTMVRKLGIQLAHAAAVLRPFAEVVSRRKIDPDDNLLTSEHANHDMVRVYVGDLRAAEMILRELDQS